MDQTQVYSGVDGHPFDFVYFGMSGPSWRPAWTAYFDDFSFKAVPEPASYAAVFGFAALGWRLWRKRSR